MLNDVYTLTSTGNVLGTVDYIAPELFVGNNKADARSDIYSLGVLLFEMVTGQRPFAAENQVALASMHVNDAPPLASILVPTISPAIERVLADALEKDPNRRFPTATAMADAFYRATKMQHSFIPAPQANTGVAAKVLDTTIEIPDQLTGKNGEQAPNTADLQASTGWQSDRKVDQQHTLLSPSIPTRTREWKRILTPLLVALLFAVAVPAAWVLGQMQTPTPSVIIRPADSGIVTKTPTGIGTITSKPAVGLPATPGRNITPSPTLSLTPAISPTAVPSPLPTTGSSQSNTSPGKTAILPPFPGNLILDPGYEMQASSQVTFPWANVGNGTIERDTQQARSGKNDARISPATDSAWTDISQLVTVKPDTTYTLSVYIHTSGDIDTDFATFNVITANGIKLAGIHFGPSPSGYSLISLTFNSSTYSGVTVQIGFSGQTSTWLQADDWYLHS